MHVGQKAGRNLAYDEPSELEMPSPLIQSCVIGLVLVYREEYRPRSTQEQNRGTPASHLMMFEMSSACKSLHRELARIRQASADSTCSSDQTAAVSLTTRAIL